MISDRPQAGWARPLPSNWSRTVTAKFHFYRRGNSLCGRYRISAAQQERVTLIRDEEIRRRQRELSEIAKEPGVKPWTMCCAACDRKLEREAERSRR